MHENKLSKSYDRAFYKSQASKNIASAKEIVPMILELVDGDKISVIDLGCGSGNWLSVFKENGCDITGVDGGDIDSSILMIPRENFIVHNFKKPYASSKKYTFSISLEVAEHIPENMSDEFIKSLTSLSDIVVFSAAIPFQRGAEHINEQWPSYWIEKFKKYDFEVADCLRNKIWINKKVRGFYAQNIFIFYKNCESNKKLKELSKMNIESMFDVVHPKVWEELNNYSFMKVIDKLHSNKLIYNIYRWIFYKKSK